MYDLYCMGMTHPITIILQAFIMNIFAITETKIQQRFHHRYKQFLTKSSANYDANQSSTVSLPNAYKKEWYCTNVYHTSMHHHFTQKIEKNHISNACFKTISAILQQKKKKKKNTFFLLLSKSGLAVQISVEKEGFPLVLISQATPLQSAHSKLPQQLLKARNHAAFLIL